jgi:DNA polymerase-3 subunit beta
MGIQRTIFAADVESARYSLGGLLLEFLEDGLHMAATDSRRLATCHLPCGRCGDASPPAQRPIVPSKAMSLIDKSIADGEQDVHIAVHHNDIQVRTGGITLYSRLVEGRFPAYKEVIPRDSTRRIELVAGPFLSAVRQAKIVTNEESRGVDFTFEGDTLTLSSVGADIGSSRIELPVSYGGAALTVTFDPNFVADFVKAFDSACPISLEMTDENSAALFRAEEHYQYVVMPLARDN